MRFDLAAFAGGLRTTPEEGRCVGPLFCLDLRFGLSKLTSQLRKDEIACDFLLTRNFTDALLLSLNSRRFPGKGGTGICFSLKSQL